MKTIIVIFITACIIGSCSDQEHVPHTKSAQFNSTEQLNITFLLDLSDRIIENREKDIELVSYVSEYFKKHIEQKNLLLIRDQMRVLFYPEPENQKINEIAEDLKIKFDPSNKEQTKNVWESLTGTYAAQLTLLYDIAEEEGEHKGYPGSDIWRFFSDKIYDYCLHSDSSYRNVLIILTDGYLYHQDSKTTEKNRTSYLTGPYLSKTGLRNNLNWQNQFHDGDFGFIAKRDDLDDLEVLVLEIDPSQVHRNDDEIIKAYWSKWLEEMKVKKYQIYCTDIPSNVEELIRLFLGN